MGQAEDTVTNLRWAKDYWQAMRAYSPRGAYINFMADEGEDRVRESYRGNYKRLVQIKRRYDPANLFRLNQNIKPCVSRPTIGRRGSCRER